MEDPETLRSVWGTLMKMLHFRGYSLPESREDEEMVKKIRKNRANFVVSKPNSEDKLILEFPKATHIDLDELTNKMRRENVQKMILVGRHSSSEWKERLEGTNIEYFSEDELTHTFSGLIVDGTRTIMEEAERRQFLERFMIQENQLPFVDEDDLIVRYLGFRKGDIFKLLEENEEFGPFVTFRRVGFMNNI